jgi:hypothetical protein
MWPCAACYVAASPYAPPVKDAGDLAGGLYRSPRNAAPPTRARYEYQDKCVVLRCIPNLLPESPVEAVAVEWSTDYALLGRDGGWELVSVKHRDPGQHDWTYGRLKAENVFRDLHAVWRAMGETGEFVFESNAGFAAALAPFGGDPDARPEPDGDAVGHLAHDLRADIAEVRRFLRHFCLRSEVLPSWQYIDAVAERDLAEVMKRLGMDPASARRCFGALVSRVAAASTQRPPEPQERVTRLVGFMRDVENRSCNDPAASLLTMIELRGIVAAESSAAARRLTSPISTGPRAAYGVEALPLAVAALDYAPVLADIGLNHFVGREWLLARIEDALGADSMPDAPKADRGRYVLVEAGAGLGKTALAGWLSRNWDCPGHFTGVPGGRDTRVALQSLAAQLIIRYGLREEFAAGGVLPSWAGDPAQFPKILAAAAQRASEEGGRVLIVVDGLDEADGEGIALGLPAVSPAGVCIVATYREGVPSHRLPSGEHVSTLTIEASDPANQQDIQRFLTDQTRDSTIAARLASAGIAPGAFVPLLAERCAGVWVYLRYVLSHIRTGPWDAAHLDRLPVGLAAYYRQQVTGRRSDPAFHSQDLVLLATLAAAEQPMTLDQLSRITRLDGGVVRTLTNYRYRPFLTVDVTSPGTPRYSVYHPSLREFLGGSPDQAGDALDTSDLRQATHNAHRRIADYYLEMFGGLDSGLSALNESPGLADHDDKYALRHLPVHLDRADRQNDLHTLLTSRNPGSVLGSTWADAHDRAGALDDYLAAIDQARSPVERKTDMLIAAGRPASSLAEEHQYALITANLVSRSAAIPVTLLEALARTGTWDSTRALAHAMRHHEPDMRAGALIALIPHLQDVAQAAQARENALNAVTAIGSEETRAELLQRLAPHLDGARLARAVDVAVAIRQDLFRAQAIASLASRLEGRARTRALRCKEQAVQNVFRISAAIGDPEQRAQALSGAAHLLEGPARARALDQALQAAAAIASQWDMERHVGSLASHLDHVQVDSALDTVIAASNASGQGLIDLAPHLTAGQLDRALAAAAALDWESERGRALAGLARHLDHEQLQRALDAAKKITDEGTRTTAQVRISLYAHAPLPGHVIDSALNSASMIEDAHSRRIALVSLARHLQGPARTRALEGALRAAASVSDLTIRGRVLRDLAPCLLPAQLEEALDAAANIDDEVGRGLALTGLAHHLEEPARRRAITGALDAVKAIKPQQGGGEVQVELVALARELGEPARHRILQHLLDTVATVQDEISRGLGLEELAPLLDPAQLACAVEIACGIRSDYTRGRVLWSLAPHLDSRQLPRALAAATMPGADDFQARAGAIASLVPHLYGQDRASALEEVLEATRPTRHGQRKWITFDDERARAELIISVASYLDAAQTAGVLEAAESFTDDGCRVSVLAALAPHLEDPARSRALARAFQAAGCIEQARPWGWALANLVPHLDRQMRQSALGQALEAAPTVRDETARADLVITVAPFLDTAQLARALQVADSFADNGCQAAVLAALATHLEQPAKSRALKKAVQAATATRDGRYLAWASAYLIPHLQEDARSQAIQRALDAAEAIRHEESRVRALADVSMHLEDVARTKCLSTVLATAVSIKDERIQARTLVALAPYLDIEQLSFALESATKLPYMADYTPCEQIFQRASFLASDVAPSDIVLLTRQFYHALPPRHSLLTATSAAAKALAQVGGPEAAVRLFESIRRY